MTAMLRNFLLPLLLAASSAFAADAPPATQDQSTRDPAAMESMADFLKTNPDCTEFTDQCSVCKVTDGKAECSTPQIACVKKAYECSRRTEQ
jgi:hypothetical protein